METVSLDAQAVVAAGDRQQPRGPGHAAVKGGVEAGHLRHVRQPPGDGLDQGDLDGQMIGIEGADPPHLVEQFRQ